MFLPSCLLLISLVSCVSGQDGSTWWIYPNSTRQITLPVGNRVTLKWTTDYPTFFIVLYQNLGDGYAEFKSTYILGNPIPFSDPSTMCVICRLLELSTLHVEIIIPLKRMRNVG